MSLSLPTAFLAGLISFLSPCVLPLVPGYISLISGLSSEKLREGKGQATPAVLVSAVAFVIGFSLVFVAMGAAASSVGTFLLKNKSLLYKFAGGIVIFFGLFLLGVFKIGSLYRERRFHGGGGRGLLGSFVLGLAFAFGWTPCIGPILGAILALAATRETVAQGTFLLAIYSVGLAVPFLLTAFGLNKFLTFSQRIRPHLLWVERFAGVLLIAMGVLIFTNQLTRLSGYLSFLNELELSLPPAAEMTEASAVELLEPLPSISLPDRNGNSLRLHNYAGKVLVVNFWATWCLPCKLEIPHFNRVFQEYHRRGVEFLGISVDAGGWEDIAEFEKEVPIAYPVVWADEAAQEAFGGLAGLPVTLFVNRQGRLAYKQVGLTELDQLRALIERLL